MAPMQSTKTKTARREEATPAETEQTTRDPETEALLDDIDALVDNIDEILEDNTTEMLDVKTRMAVDHIIVANQEDLYQELVNHGFILLPCGC
jgi:hypothetical protein